MKGVGAPLQVFALGSPVASSLRRTVGASRLVGRGEELAVLDVAVNMACEGQFQVVGVVGEAGVGKSRLCDEFARSVGERGITVRRAVGVSHGKEVPLLPMLAFQREYFGIGDGDDAPAARQKVTDRLLELDPGLEDTLPLLFDFLEVPDPDRPVPAMAPEVRMRRLFDAVRRITVRRSERETLVLVFEDLHWFDPQSEAFLERLIESYPGSRTLVVTNFRPEFSARWMRHSYYRQLPLSPLPEQAIGELLGGLLGVDLSMAPLVSFILERTGGNPFFVEEVVRGLIEDGTLAGGPGNYRLTRSLHEIRVPPSVQAVLAARIDRLPIEQKALLETASVIGRTFDRVVLSRVKAIPADELDDALSALCGAELLQDAGGDPSREYRYWHPLTQEVA
ncbi:MAG TPA: AAA family ATPase, partial [Acidimicrobiia bacterium]|nr:AAA family ATPase [Acidimicrobiia bacterium]